MYQKDSAESLTAENMIYSVLLRFFGETLKRYLRLSD